MVLRNVRQKCTKQEEPPAEARPSRPWAAGQHLQQVDTPRSRVQTRQNCDATGAWIRCILVRATPAGANASNLAMQTPRQPSLAGEVAGPIGAWFAAQLKIC